MTNDENREVSINAEYLRLAQLFCSKEETRYYLTGVHVEPCPDGGVLLVATDSHKMAVFRDEDGYVPDEMLIALDAGFIRALKVDKKDGGLTRRVTVRNDRLTIVLSDSDGTFGEETYIKPGKFEIDGDFPEWRRVLPQRAENSLFSVDLSVLKTFEIVAKSLTGTSRVHFVPSGSSETPIAVTTGCEDFYGVIMPCRLDARDSQPSWCHNED